MEIEIPLPTDEQLTPEDEGLPISIRKLDRLETTNRSNSQGA
jgi:hypothetical protein